MTSVIDVIIPAFNEAPSIGKVVKDIPKDWVRDIIVVNNNSSDTTSEIAKAAGATVVDEPISGYGRACLKGMDFISKKSEAPDIVVFLDGDYSDHPEQLPDLVKPIISGEYQFIVGSRALGKKEKGAMTVQQIFGNKLATFLLKMLYKVRYTDLGPFRAISYPALLALEMKDLTYGWTVEMQVKAAKQKLKSKEVPVDYRKRIGFSKISGTIKGTVLAGYKIITTIIKYR